AYRKKRESDRERLQAMLDYANARRCRTQMLLGYFGQEVPACGRCDICTGKLGASTEDDESEEETAARMIPELPSVPPPPRKNPPTPSGDRGDGGRRPLGAPLMRGPEIRGPAEGGTLASP